VDALRQHDVLARRVDQVQAIEKRLTGEGTSFPSGPITGSRFYRSDLGFECYYDGTRWLTVHEYEAVLTWYWRIAVPYAGGSPATLMLVPLRTDHAVYFTRCKAYADVTAPNNGKNYWGWQLTIGTTAVFSFDTSGDAAATALNKEGSTAAVCSGTTFAKGEIVAKVGAPGAIVLNAAFWYRLIIT